MNLKFKVSVWSLRGIHRDIWLRSSIAWTWSIAIIRQQAFLPVKQLLCWDMNTLRLAVCHRNLSAFLPRDGLAVWTCLRSAVGSLLYLTAKGICHSSICHGFWLMVPQFLMITTCNLWYYELHILVY